MPYLDGELEPVGRVGHDAGDALPAEPLRGQVTHARFQVLDDDTARGNWSGQILKRASTRE